MFIFSLFSPIQNLDSLKGERFCSFDGQKCRLQPESESQAEFFSIPNNRDLAGQILPWFTHLFNSIIIRFNVMAGIDKWVGFWFCRWNLVDNSVYSVESSSTVSQSCLWLYRDENREICEKWFSLEHTSQTMVGLWERSGLQKREFPFFCWWEVCLALSSQGNSVSVQSFWINLQFPRGLWPVSAHPL